MAWLIWEEKPQTCQADSLFGMQHLTHMLNRYVEDMT